MDGVFARMNYCLSATGEEYLYYTLRTPGQKDDYNDLEKKVGFFATNHEKRRKMQILFAKIGRRIRYSIRLPSSERLMLAAAEQSQVWFVN